MYQITVIATDMSCLLETTLGSSPHLCDVYVSLLATRLCLKIRAFTHVNVSDHFISCSAQLLLDFSILLGKLEIKTFKIPCTFWT